MTDTSTEAIETQNRQRRYQKAAELLRRWMAQADEYDEQTWPMVERDLKNSALRCEERDESGS